MAYIAQGQKKYTRISFRLHLENMIPSVVCNKNKRFAYLSVINPRMCNKIYYTPLSGNRWLHVLHTHFR